MGWPLSQDYNEAIQSPETSFSDPELKQGEVVCNALGIPMPRSGNFADVYEFRCTNGSRWAIKCFTRQVLGLRERYQEISFALQEAKLPFTVEFTYLEEGIRIHGQWFPILKMQWVEGLTFNDFVRQNLDKPAMLDGLLQIWSRMAQRLRAAGIAHADLQHGNVLLVPGSTANAVAVKLIDYDGMFVPGLADKPSGEVGHPSYQHPQRVRESRYNAEVDRFPLLLIATALRCVRVGGRSLWEKYDNGDNLLFREEDLKNPAGSKLFTELEGLSDDKGKTLVGLLRKALAGPLDGVPLLEEALPELATPTVAARAGRVAPVSLQPVVTPVAPLPVASLKRIPSQTATRVSAATNLAFDDLSSTRKRQRARKGSMPLWVWAAVAAGVFVLIVGIGGIAVYALSGKSDGNIPETNVQANLEPSARDTVDTTLKKAIKDSVKDNNPKKPDKESTRGRPSEATRSVNLLALIDPRRDALKGKWVLDGQALVTSSEEGNYLNVPYSPPKEYDLKLTVERKTGDQCFTVYLPGGGSAFFVQLDGWPRDGFRSGLQLMDKKYLIDQESSWKGQVLTLGTRVDLDIAVRRSEVQVTANGKHIVSFNGDFNRLSFEECWPIPKRNSFYIAGFLDSTFHVTKMELTPFADHPGAFDPIASTRNPGNDTQPRIPDRTDPPTRPITPVTKKDPETEKNKKIIDGVVYKPGLVAELFPNEDLQNRTGTTIDKNVDVNWGYGSPPGLPNDHFSVRWQGWLIAPKDNYTFFVHVDDGTRVFVDDKMLFDRWSGGGKHYASMDLSEAPHHLRIEFREITGTAMMVFGWKSPTGDEAVPKEWLFHDDTQVKDPVTNLAQNPAVPAEDGVLHLRQELSRTTRVYSCAVSADGKFGLSCSGFDGTIHLWNLETGAMRDLQTHYKRVSGLAFLAGNDSFLFSADDGNLHFWDIDNPEADDPDRKWVQLFNKVNLKGWKLHPADKAQWSIKSGAIVGEKGPGDLFTERDDYTDFRFRIEARLSAKGNSGMFFRTAFGQSVPVGYEAEIESKPGPNGMHTGSLVPLDGMNLTKEEKEKLIVRNLLVRPDTWFIQEVIAQGNHIIIKVNGKTTVDFVDKSNNFRKGHLAIQQGDPAGNVMVSKAEVMELPQDRNRSTRVLDPGPADGYAAVVSDLAVSPDGKRALSSNGDLIRGWDLGTDKRLSGEWPKLPSGTFALRLSADGKYAVSYHHDHWGRVWDMANGTALMTFGNPQEGGDLRSIAMAADGKLVVTGTVDGRIQWHNPETKQSAFRELPSLGVPVKALALSPDGRYLVAAGEGVGRNFLVVFDVASGKEVQRLENTPVQSNMLKFAANSSCLLAGDDAGGLRVFDLTVKSRSRP
jgi:WD40 repeat protein